MVKCCICNKEMDVYKEKVHYRSTDQEPLCDSCNELQKSAKHAAKQPKPRVVVEFCRNCGGKISEGQKICLSCGFEPLNGYNNCQNCGVVTKNGQKLCISCGFELLGKEDVEAIERCQPTGRTLHLSKDEPSMGFAFLGIFIPLLGLILYLVWREDYPKKASSCIKGAGLGVIVGFIMTFIGQSLYRY